MSPGPSLTIPTAPTPTSYGQSARPRPGRAFTITIDQDLLPVLEDQAGSHALPMNEFIQKVVVEALRVYTGM